MVLEFYILSENGVIIQAIKCRNYFNHSGEISQENSYKNAYGELDSKTFLSLRDSIVKLFGKSTDKNRIIDIIKGDFNGDMQTEVAWLELKFSPFDTACYDYREKTVIRFSNKRIKRIPLDIYGAYGLANLGDLNNDGFDEIGISADPYPGNTECFIIYAFINNKWECLDAIDNTLNMRESGIKYIEKDTLKKGYCKLRIPLLFYNNQMNLIPEKYLFDSVTGQSLLTPTFSHVVEIIVKFE